MQRCQLVFLIPGFLGFDHFQDFAYFAERCALTLRATLAQHVRPGGPQVRVIAVPIPPTAGLASRQRALAKTLQRRAQALAQSEGLEIQGIQLVGHSSGGVDAQLLTLERPLAAQSKWRNLDGTDVTWLRERLRSVISLASPHQGTCLAVDPLARMLAAGDPLHLLTRTGPALKEIVQLVAALPGLISDPDLPELLGGVLGSAAGRSFISDLWSSRDLINDLVPDLSVGRYASLGAPLPLLRRSFVTVAGLSPSAQASALESAHRRSRARERPKPLLADQAPAVPPDALFLLLASLTSGRNTECAAHGPLLQGSMDALRRALSDPSKVISASPDLLPQQVDAALNDGVVNSVRQLIDPADAQELEAVVIADHFDVIGHFDRTLWVTDPKTSDEKPVNVVSGLLHSGSEFRDNQFFALVDRVGACLAPLLQD